MKATRFMRVPFFATGYRVTADNMDTIAKWCEGHVIRDVSRPFVRVPVNRPTHKKQTEAYEDTWVIVTIHRGERSFKVYTRDLLDKQFFELPDEDAIETIPDEPTEKENPHHQASNVHHLPTQSSGPAPMFQAPRR